MVKAKKKARYSGTAAVETAIVFPILLLLTFGVIEYGWLFLKAHQITNAARQGARIAILPGASNEGVIAAIDSLMTAAEMGSSGYTITFSDDVSSVPTGNMLTVTVTVSSEAVALMNIPFLPDPNNIGASVTMAKEGP